MPAFSINAAGAQPAFTPDTPQLAVAVGAIGDTWAGTIRLEAEYADLPNVWFQVAQYTAPAIASVGVPTNRQARLRFNATAWTSGIARCVLQQ